MTVKLLPIKSKVNRFSNLASYFSFKIPSFSQFSMAVARRCNGWNLNTSSSRNAWQTGLETSSGSFIRALSISVCILQHKVYNPLPPNFFSYIESNRQYDVRLLHGKAFNEGIVQVRSLESNVWSFVDTSNWTDKNSHTVCRQLGYLFASASSNGTWVNLNFPEADSPILLSHFKCTDEDDSLDACNVSMLEEVERDRIVALRCEDFGM